MSSSDGSGSQDVTTQPMPGSGVHKPKRHLHPGTKAKRLVKKWSMGKYKTRRAIPETVIARRIRHLARAELDDARVSKKTVTLLHAIAEREIARVFGETVRLLLITTPRRVTAQGKDIRFLTRQDVPAHAMAPVPRAVGADA